MTLEITFSQNDQAETRYHLDAVRCTHVLRGVPAWITDRPTEGGTHSLETCERCANSARIRAMLKQASMDECEAMRSEDKVQTQLQRDSYVADNDHRRNVMRTCLRYVALAERTPVRKLPQTIRELRVIAATHKVHADLGHGASARTLQMWASASADVAWERYRLAYHAS